MGESVTEARAREGMKIRTRLASSDPPTDDPCQRLEVVLVESFLGDDDVRGGTYKAI
jgi:hypothetical protein